MQNYNVLVVVKQKKLVTVFAESEEAALLRAAEPETWIDDLDDEILEVTVDGIEKEEAE